MTAKKKPDAFVRLLEAGVRDVLKNPAATPADRLKAIEVGAKLALIQHKVKAGDDDAFFG
jgi:hypothetical protein